MQQERIGKSIYEKKGKDEKTNLYNLIVTPRLNLLVFQFLQSLLVHLAVGAPAEEEEGHYDEDAADDGAHGEGLAGAHPVDDGDEEDGEEGGDGGENGGGERDEDEEGAGECCFVG